jgi:uncharacterized membrane protein YuzA (DUF378 family)
VRLSPVCFRAFYSRTPTSDWLIGNATTQSSLIPTTTLTNGTTYSGQSSYGGYVYQTNVQYVSGYLSNTSNGINHFLSVGANGTNACDGLVALMNVQILTNTVSGSSKTSSCVFFHLIGVAALIICVSCLFRVAGRDHTHSPHSSQLSLYLSPCSLLHYSSLNLSGLSSHPPPTSHLAWIY